MAAWRFTAIIRGSNARNSPSRWPSRKRASMPW
ncbi:hypothetical protein LG943_21670 [Streptomonospora sp. S1-112]|uniref:Uncharacterized protein n=1 Tax=Streptomonospora mangrovi TaxID=2883123 RepID=A0A9X3NYS5_9ACTN|nr:hypothetical protein [Streptomonospora mangrovi]